MTDSNIPDQHNEGHTPASGKFIIDEPFTQPAAPSARERGSDSQLTAGLDGAALRRAVKGARELDTTYRVYVKEWVHEVRLVDMQFAQTSESEAQARERAESYISAKLRGRYRDKDIRVVVDRFHSAAIQARKWNIHSEWNSKKLADMAAAMVTVDESNTSKTEHTEAAHANRGAIYETENVEVVVRNSRREHELTNYGTLKLPSTSKA